jgi:hypothetical protein
MATTDLPATLLAAHFEWGLRKTIISFKSPQNGTAQNIDFMSERWVASMTLPPRLRESAGEVEGFFNFLSGGFNRVRLFHQGRGANAATHGLPYGTLRGTPTLAVAAVRGNNSLVLQTAANATVKAGDMLGIGAHLLQARSTAVANGSGVMTLLTANRARGSIAAGSAVVWNKPTAEFILPANSLMHAFHQNVLAGGTFDLEEWF